MRRGQGSLEYLLILAAILAIAVVIILIANMLLGTPQEANKINTDKYNFAINGWEIRGYNKPFDPSDPCASGQRVFVKNGRAYLCNPAAPPAGAEPIGTITDSGGNTHTVYTDNGSYYVDVGQEPVCGDGACNGDEVCDDGSGGAGICASDCGDCSGNNNGDTYYLDSDDDGYGNASISVQAASQPSGYVTDSTDCDDSDASVWKLQNGYHDYDGDGVGAGDAVWICSGNDLPEGYTHIQGDCNDSDASVHPGADELCGNGIDDDCDGVTDETDCVTSTYCGDGAVQDPNDDGVSEQCDNGTENGVACTPPYGGTCAWCSSDCLTVTTVTGPYCGDGNADASYGEQCDDGNTDDNDCCLSNCQYNNTGTITCGTGVCENTVQKCIDGVEQTCTPKSPAESPEVTCNDGLDNDCDGLADRHDYVDCPSWEQAAAYPAYSAEAMSDGLYIGSSDGKLYRYDGLWALVHTFGSGGEIIISLAEDGTTKYAVVKNGDRALVYKEAAGSWAQIGNFSYVAEYNWYGFANQIAAYGGNLYMANGYQTVSKYNGTSWTNIFTEGAGTPSNMMDVGVYNGELYALAWSTGVFRLWKYNGGTSWTDVWEYDCGWSCAGERMHAGTADVYIGAIAYSGANRYSRVYSYPAKDYLFGNNGADEVLGLGYYGGKLFEGTYNAGTYEYDGAAAFKDSALRAYAFAEYGGNIYAATPSGIYRFIG